MPRNGVIHFAEVSKIVEAGATTKPVSDFKLTRYPCYLILQNADSRNTDRVLWLEFLCLQVHAFKILYKCTCKFEEGDIVSYEKKLVELIEGHNGMILSSQVDHAGIPRMFLTKLHQKGEVERIARGVYLTPEALDDEMFRIQSRYGKGIYSHGTALYLHDLTDRTPLFYTMTFPSGYHAASLSDEEIKSFYIDTRNYRIGEMMFHTPLGRTIIIYNLERTICDILRSRNQLDSYVINDAVKRYVARKDKNLNLLMEYGELFRVERIIRQTIEVLL